METTFSTLKLTNYQFFKRKQVDLLQSQLIKAGDLFMTHIYPVKRFEKGWNGATPEDLAYRLAEVQLDVDAFKQAYGEFIQKHPLPVVKPESLTQTEWENYLSTKEVMEKNPLTGVSPDQKGQVIFNEFQDAQKADAKNRKASAEVLENRVQNELRAIGISPEEYQYSIEYQKEIEGGDE
ncbi:hypothetical protein A2375_01980 [Candidatus Woesebacteria bacterium RIFOXYB1_FULL_31_120]|nr:MAG: hypothetical protein A2375_01980 [Candidatus Woesebacteria bacterium RIFOXYB1_FULL_31_120]